MKKFIILLIILLSFNFVNAEKVGDYPFNENGGSITYDISIYNNSGYFINPPTFWHSGKENLSIYLNFTQFININYSESLKFDKNFSFSIWINVSDSDYYHGILGRDSPTDRQFFLSTKPYTSYFVIYFERAGFPILESSTQLLNNNWYLITLTYNSSNLSLYINDSLDIVIPMEVLPLKSSNLTIGERDYSPFDYKFKGSLDKFLLYNHTLTELEIKELYSPTPHLINFNYINRDFNTIFKIYYKNGSYYKDVLADESFSLLDNCDYIFLIYPNKPLVISNPKKGLSYIQLFVGFAFGIFLIIGLVFIIFMILKRFF